LGNALLDLGRPDEATASCRRALEFRPDYAEAHHSMGNALLTLGQLDEALANYRRALALKPDFAEAHNNEGSVLRGLGRLDEAMASYRCALQINPDFAEAHGNLAIALRLLGRTAEAQLSCRRALEINPNSGMTVAVLAELHADKGQFTEAEDLFRRAISIEPELPEAWAGLSRVRKFLSCDAAWLVEAQRIAGLALAPRKEAHLRYAIGKYFDDVGEFDQAFGNYRRANELSRQCANKHDRRNLTQTIDRIIQTCDRRWISRARTDSSTSQRPVFVIGMLRSGTSLVEQIIASHPSAFGAGEQPFWTNASAAYRPRTREAKQGGNPVPPLAGEYLHLLQHLSATALRVVDKMPGNFMALGLIHAALPNARIIHMRRNPLDTCLSIYFQHFETGVSYANDLHDLAHFYTEYWRLMKHWRITLGEAAILDVSYEGLVEDQEAWSRKILAFVGLPWDPRCMDFHLTDRTVVTASKWQVRQRISGSSVGRWRNYEKFVGPLLELMNLVSSA
jgi:tetratricopeptide (TPR) repeat protein